MPVLSKGQTFATGDQVTALKLNNLVDNAAFASGAVDNVSTQLSGGAIIVRDGGVSTAKLADSAVTAVKLADGSVSTAKVQDLGISTAKLADAAVSTAKLADASVSTVKLADASVSAAKLASGTYASAAEVTSGTDNTKIVTPLRLAAAPTTAKAWVNFDGTGTGTFAGGASTVTRVAGSTTATVTTTNDHGLITGNTVWALTGVAAGSYTVTVTGAKTFTITTVATTALSAVSITFAVNAIRASYNVSSITDNGTGDYTINFATPMVDANYAAVFGGRDTNDVNGDAIIGMKASALKTSSALRIASIQADNLLYDLPEINVVIFR